MAIREMSCIKIRDGILMIKHITLIRKREDGKTAIRMTCGLEVVVPETVAQVMEHITSELLS